MEYNCLVKCYLVGMTCVCNTGGEVRFKWRLALPHTHSRPIYLDVDHIYTRHSPKFVVLISSILLSYFFVYVN